MTPNKASLSEFVNLYLGNKSFFNHAFLISFLINLLAFAVPLHMLQVYDRVLTSGHSETLLVITSAVVFALILQGVLDTLRSRLLLSLARVYEKNLREKIFFLSVLSASKRKPGNFTLLWQMCQSVKAFISGPWMGAFLDLPWVPLYLAVIYQFHPLMGLSSILAAIMMISVALINHKATQANTAKVTGLSQTARDHLDSSIRNAEAIKGLGMLPHVNRIWEQRLDQADDATNQSQSTATSLTSLSKFLRLFIQVWTLSLGAYLVINQEMSAGGIIANSIMLTKALSSIELISSGWKNIQEAMHGLQKLHLAEQSPELEEQSKTTIVKAPEGRLTSENIFLHVDSPQRAILKGISFSLNRGDVLAIVGQSGSGKSSLIRVLLGIWEPSNGNARMDGMDVRSLGNDFFFENVGYLPQQVLLYPGTVGDNIARLSERNKEKILEAAQAAGCHELIAQLPKGYDTEVGPNGGNLSLGQQQRIALARAMYGRPAYLFLDEPNSNLDSEGEAALKQAIANAANQGVTAILVAHRSSMLTLCNKVLVLNNGQQMLFGPRDEVLQKIASETRGNA